MPTVHIGLTYPDLIAHIAPEDLAERAERWGFGSDIQVMLAGNSGSATH